MAKSTKCANCGESFKAANGRQIYCKRDACAKERRSEYWSKYIVGWKKAHPGYWQNYLKKWRSSHPNYFKEWRKKHPGYFKAWYQKKKAAKKR